jgi:hypothetical protein
MPPDYTLYPDNNISYGFISRGCSRKCSFCVVPAKEGKTKFSTPVTNIIEHPVVKFLDNNILSLPNHEEILEELVELRVKCQFMQGLDLRLVNPTNARLLHQLNYLGEYIFAFDNWKYRRAMERKIELLSWRRDWQLKFYVYIDPEMALSDHIRRVEWLRDHKCLPYIMRGQRCWGAEHEKFYTDYASWCNQPALFKKMTFPDFMERRYLSPSSALRVEKVLATYAGASHALS